MKFQIVLLQNWNNATEHGLVLATRSLVVLKYTKIVYRRSTLTHPAFEALERQGKLLSELSPRFEVSSSVSQVQWPPIILA